MGKTEALESPECVCVSECVQLLRGNTSDFLER